MHYAYTHRMAVYNFSKCRIENATWTTLCEKIEWFRINTYIWCSIFDCSCACWKTKYSWNQSRVQKKSTSPSSLNIHLSYFMLYFLLLVFFPSAYIYIPIFHAVFSVLFEIMYVYVSSYRMLDVKAFTEIKCSGYQWG